MPTSHHRGRRCARTSRRCTPTSTSRTTTPSTAYALWRINWIHPFAPDGNGRVARAVALVVLFSGLRRMPPAKVGRPTFLHRLAQRKYAYLDALEAADAAWARSEVDVFALEALLEEVLAYHLEDIGPAAP